MLKISEFARLANTTRRTLLFYDEKGIFSPAKIAKNGYRYYDVDQLYQFEMISGLRQLGISLEEIQVILSSDETTSESYLVKYHQKIKAEIQHLQMLERLLEMRQNFGMAYEKILHNKVTILTDLEQEFWCTELAVDCVPDDIARLYSKFMRELGDITNKVPSCSGFLTELPLETSQEFMTGKFRFIKEITALDGENLMPKLTKPAGRFVSIKVDTTLTDILSGLKQLKLYVQKNNLQVDDHLWQLNTDNDLVKNGSSSQQILQYRIIEKRKA